MKFQIKNILILSMLFACSIMQATTYFVSPTGGGTGASWNSPISMNTLIPIMASGDTAYFKEGNYVVTTSKPFADNKDGYFYFKGGFPSTATGTDISGYNPALYITSISGSRTFFGNKASAATQAYFYGLTFDGGTTNTPIIYGSSGTGTFIADQCTFKNLNITSGAKGTAIDIKQKTFSGNYIIKITNSSFTNNSNTTGSDISIENDESNTTFGNLLIEYCTFSGQEGTNNGYPKNLYLKQVNYMTVRNNCFTNNGLNSNKGYGAVYLENANNILFTKNVLANNRAGGQTGGGLNTKNGSGTIDDNNFYNNYSKTTSTTTKFADIDLTGSPSGAYTLTNNKLQLTPNSTNYPNATLGSGNTLNAATSVPPCPSAVCTNPVINSITPSSQNVIQNGTPTTITVNATGAASYQWYSNSTNSNSGGTLISGATSSSYVPSTNTLGTKYYYVVAISGACSTTSSAVSVTVSDACTFGASTDGTPTATDTDGDGINNTCDLDDDNDGILDTDEGYSKICASAGGFTSATFTTITANSHYKQQFGTNSIDYTNIGSSNISPFTETTSGSNELYASGTAIRVIEPSIGAIQKMTFTNPAKITFAVVDLDQPGEKVRVTIYDEFGIKISNPAAYIKTTVVGTSGTFPGTPTTFSDIGTALTKVSGADFVDVSQPTNNNGNEFVRANMVFFDISALKISRIDVANTGTSGTSGVLFDCIVTDSIDTDGDGIPDYLDTDSDNDGCPDATEGAAHLATTATLTGGSNGGSSANLGTTVNANGIPTSAATSATTGQATTTGVTSAVRVNAGTTPPATQTANTGTTVTLTSNATADAATTWATTTPFAPNYTTPGNATSGLTYSWTKDGTAVTNGGGISGATTAALTLTGVTAASAGTYVVTVRHPNNYCGTFTQTILTINAACYDLPNNGAGELPTNHGITTLQRAGSEVSNGNWPMVRTGAWTVLESKTKGFVITRMTTLEIEGQTTPTVILSQITNPQEGMMVYDKTAKCLKIYSDSAWKCFQTPACP